MGSQAKVPAPLDREALCITMGQALPPANFELMPIFPRALTLAARNEDVINGSLNAVLS